MYRRSLMRAPVSKLRHQPLVELSLEYNNIVIAIGIKTCILEVQIVSGGG